MANACAMEHSCGQTSDPEVRFDRSLHGVAETHTSIRSQAWFFQGVVMSIHGKKFGIMLPQREGAMGGETARGGDLLALAAMAEELGFDSVWLVDHFLWHVPELSRYGEPVPRGEEGVRFGFWECWAIASALAAATTHIEIGTLVVNTGYRNPALLARIADTVDELSDGRLILGLGAGAVLGEYEAFGYDYERRVGRFEEALQIIKPMLRGRRSRLKASSIALIERS